MEMLEREAEHLRVELQACTSCLVDALESPTNSLGEAPPPFE